MVRHRSIAWEEIQRDCLALAVKLRPLGPWTGIVALARGGLVPAALVSRVLGIRLIETVCLASYDGTEKGPVRLIKSVDGRILERGAGWLLVDDLVDSGATMAEARRLLPEAHAAVLYAKPAGIALADTHVEKVDQDVWLDFPWEVPVGDGGIGR